MINDIRELVRLRKDRETVTPMPAAVAEEQEDSCVVFFVVEPGVSEKRVEQLIIQFQKDNADVFGGGKYYHLGSRANGRALNKSFEKALGLSKKKRVDIEGFENGK